MQIRSRYYTSTSVTQELYSVWETLNVVRDDFVMVERVGIAHLNGARSSEIAPCYSNQGLEVSFVCTTLYGWIDKTTGMTRFDA